MRKAILAVLALSAAQAAAQSSAPQQTPTPAPQTPPAAERKASPSEPRLNLKLDQPASFYVRETQPATPADGLPTLGGGTLNFNPPPVNLKNDARGAYPVDAENSRR